MSDYSSDADLVIQLRNASTYLFPKAADTLMGKAADEIEALRNRVTPTCTWTPLPDQIDAYEACASIHHVSRDDDGPALPAFCEDCGGRVVCKPSKPGAT